MKAACLRFDELPHDLVERLNAGSLYGTTGFAKLWRETGGTDKYWVVSRGSTIIATLPIVEYGRSLFKRAQAMPDGCYSGFNVLESDFESEARESLVAELAKRGYFRLTLVDYRKEWHRRINWPCQVCSSIVLDISPSDWAPNDSKLLAQYRKSSKDGVVCRQFNMTDMDAFFGVMNVTERRHNRKPKYSRAFFNSLAALADQEDRILWLVAYVEQQMAASQIFFIDGETALSWQTYFDKRLSTAKPGVALTFDAIARLKKRGVRLLNLGASPTGAQGLISYKERWGGEPYEYHVYTHTNWMGGL